MLCAHPVEVFHNRRKLRLQAEEVAQLLGSRLEQGGLTGAGDFAEVLVSDHDAPGELDDSRAARQGDLHAHRRSAFSNRARVTLPIPTRSPATGTGSSFT